MNLATQSCLDSLCLRAADLIDHCMLPYSCLSGKRIEHRSIPVIWRLSCPHPGWHLDWVSGGHSRFSGHRSGKLLLHRVFRGPQSTPSSSVPLGSEDLPESLARASPALKAGPCAGLFVVDTVPGTERTRIGRLLCHAFGTRTHSTCPTYIHGSHAYPATRTDDPTIRRLGQFFLDFYVKRKTKQQNFEVRSLAQGTGTMIIDRCGLPAFGRAPYPVCSLTPRPSRSSLAWRCWARYPGGLASIIFYSPTRGVFTSIVAALQPLP
jgi:hypothetical protein